MNIICERPFDEMKSLVHIMDWNCTGDKPWQKDTISCGTWLQCHTRWRRSPPLALTNDQTLKKIEVSLVVSDGMVCNWHKDICKLYQSWFDVTVSVINKPISCKSSTWCLFLSKYLSLLRRHWIIAGQFKAYLSYCRQHRNAHLTVPQKTMFEPILLPLCTTPLGAIAQKHKSNYHVYADDTLPYIVYKPNNTDSLHKILNNIQCCVVDVDDHLATTGHEQSRRFNSPWPGATCIRDFLWSFPQHLMFASLISVLFSPVVQIYVVTIDSSTVTKIVVGRPHLLFLQQLIYVAHLESLS